MWILNNELGTVDATGRDFATTRKYRNVRANPHAALVVDDLASMDRWPPRAVVIEGTATAVTRDGVSGLIRIVPTKIISWGARLARDLNHGSGQANGTSLWYRTQRAILGRMRAITAPILPCADLDRSISFYEALGFKPTYRQQRPNPSAVVQRGDIVIHRFGLDNFDPEASYGSVIIAVSDPDTLYAEFATGLRERFGNLPSTGIPRILRPRKRHGTVRGFSVVDPGGNWLRVSKLGDEERAEETTTGLARVIENAARIGDAKGDDLEAARLLRSGLERYSDAPSIERARALLYLAELYARVGDRPAAHDSLTDASVLELSDDERESLSADLAHTREVVG